MIGAFQNVADALHAIRGDADALAATARAERAAAQSRAIAQDQQRSGQISAAQVLGIEQIYRIASIARIQAQTTQLEDTTALFQALGGGWWNRKDS